MSLIRPACTLNGRLGQTVRFAFADRQPPLQAMVAVAEAFRSAALAKLQVITGGCDSFLLSGHNSDGTPDREHRHVYYLPEAALDGSPTLTGILVVSPTSRFIEQELSALRAIEWLRWNGPSSKTTLEFVDTDDQASELLASRWVSSTPYVPYRRFWGMHGKRHLTPDKQLIRELSDQAAGNEVIHVDIKPWMKVHIRLARTAAKLEKTDRAKRQSFRATFVLKQPVCGPIALGHSGHFGLGQFMPAKGN